MDDLATQYGQNDIRATTRQCFQIHGILKGDLKTVIAALMNIGSSTVGVRALLAVVWVWVFLMQGIVCKCSASACSCVQHRRGACSVYVCCFV